MGTSPDQLSVPPEHHPILKYSTIGTTIASSSIVLILLALTQISLGLFIGLLTLCGSIYLLTTTKGFKYWNSIASNHKLVFWCTIGGLLVNLFLVPGTVIAASLYATLAIGFCVWAFSFSHKKKEQRQAQQEAGQLPTPGNYTNTTTSWLTQFTNTPLPSDYLQNLTVYKILLPKETIWNAENAHTLAKQMLRAFDDVTFQIVAEANQIHWQIVMERSEQRNQFLLQAVRSSYPDAEVLITLYQPSQFHQPFHRLALLVLKTNVFEWPLTTILELPKVDPLSLLTHHMCNLPPNARIVYTLQLKQYLPEEALQAVVMRQTRIAIPEIEFTERGMGRAVGELVARRLTGREREPVNDPRTDEMLARRFAESDLCDTHLMCHFDFPIASEPPQSNIKGIFYALTQFKSEWNDVTWHPSNIDFNDFIKLPLLVNSPEVEIQTSPVGLLGQWSKQTGSIALSASETAALWHLPHKGFTAPEIVWIPSKRGLIPPQLASNSSGVLIGDNVVANQSTPVYIRDQDRTTHMSVIGKPGMGKSTLLHNLIRQDIAHGHAVAVIDPHGKLVSDILRYSIPENRLDDVVIIDLKNEDYPPPLNPLIIPDQPGQIALGRVEAALETVYDFSQAKRALEALTQALITLSVETTPTLRDVARLFEEPDYRDKILRKAAQVIDNDVTWDFWNMFQNASDNYQKDLVYPVLSRIRTFYGTPTLYPIMCHPEPLDFAKLIKERKIILVSLKTDEEKIHTPERHLIGSVILSMLQSAGMKSWKEKPQYFFLYIDEVQNFVNTNLDVVLAEARKNGVGITMANQYLSQLKKGVLEAVIGTVGTLIVYQIGKDDAKELKSTFSPVFEPEDLINLDRYTAVVKTTAGELALPPFSLVARGEPPQEPGVEKREKGLRNRSRMNWTPRDKQYVMNWLRQRYPRNPPPSGNNQGGWTIPPKQP